MYKCMRFRADVVGPCVCVVLFPGSASVYGSDGFCQFRTSCFVGMSKVRLYRLC